MNAEKIPLKTTVFRFLALGAVNTAITGLLVIGLSFVIEGWAAFTIAFALGIVISTVASGRWVFASKSSHRRSLMFGLSYVVIYLAGLCWIAMLDRLAVSPAFNGTSVFLTAPLSFLAGRVIYSRPVAPAKEM